MLMDMVKKRERIKAQVVSDRLAHVEGLLNDDDQILIEKPIKSTTKTTRTETTETTITKTVRTETKTKIIRNVLMKRKSMDEPKGEPEPKRARGSDSPNGSPTVLKGRKNSPDPKLIKVTQITTPTRAKYQRLSTDHSLARHTQTVVKLAFGTDPTKSQNFNNPQKSPQKVATTTEQEEPVKRKRGRPRKYPLPNPDEQVIKIPRPRGRPPLKKPKIESPTESTDTELKETEPKEPIIEKPRIGRPPKSSYSKVTKISTISEIRKSPLSGSRLGRPSIVRESAVARFSREVSDMALSKSRLLRSDRVAPQRQMLTRSSR